MTEQSVPATGRAFETCNNTAQSVCAVIVTYNPSPAMLENIPRVLAQVGALVAVDNGSAGDAVAMLRGASNRLGFHVMENNENLGIAEALNQGVRWAKKEGYPWVILFDQDSTVEEGFVEQMLATWNSHPQRERIASVQPTYRDPKTGFGPIVRRAPDGGPITSLTSGSLMPAWTFDRVGCFASEYFIDFVDIEYCFRIRASGYIIAESKEAVLAHSPGAPEPRSILGFSFQPTHHNAVRRYYMSRNRAAVFRKYFRVFPRWVLQSMYECSRETIKCFVSERDRARKFRSFLLGTWDGLTGRMGKREGI